MPRSRKKKRKSRGKLNAPTQQVKGGKQQQLAQHSSQQDAQLVPRPPSPKYKGSYDRFGTFRPFYDIYPSDDEPDDRPSYQHPLFSLHDTDYIPGADNFQAYDNWSDLGERYRKGTGFSLFGLLGESKPLPKDEMNYLSLRGVHFEKKLGSGSFGSVWIVSKTTINSGKLEKIRMACKIIDLKTLLPPSYLRWLIKPRVGLEEMVDELVTEADIHRKLVHKHITKCEFVYRIQDQKTGFPYCRLLLFMELCGGDLLSLIVKSPKEKFTEFLAKNMLRQLSEGLKFIHNQNICHFDIKPENILYKIDAQNELIYMLSDLGLAIKFESDRDTYDEIRGNFYHMAPEVKLGRSSFMPKPADIYSLGCVLAEALVGPSYWYQFVGYLKDTAEDEVQAFCNSYKLSQRCAQLLFRMTNVDPNRRPTVGEVITAPWLN